jgi:hypothetical protein
LAQPASVGALDAMARLARQTGLVVHVVVPREAAVVQHARTLARDSGLDLSVDLMPYSIRARFSPRP